MALTAAFPTPEPRECCRLCSAHTTEFRFFHIVSAAEADAEYGGNRCVCMEPDFSL